MEKRHSILLLVLSLLAVALLGACLSLFSPTDSKDRPGEVRCPDTSVTHPFETQPLKDDDILSNDYHKLLWDQVLRHWVPPRKLVSGLTGLVTIVVVGIDKGGHVRECWVAESSGSSHFDACAVNAVQYASPFPPLPDWWQAPLYLVGFRFDQADLSRSNSQENLELPRLK